MRFGSDAVAQLSAPEPEEGRHKVVSIDEVRSQGYALAVGRYVGSIDVDPTEEVFEELFPKLIVDLRDQLQRAESLTKDIKQNLRAYGFVI